MGFITLLCAETDIAGPAPILTITPDTIQQSLRRKGLRAVDLLKYKITQSRLDLAGPLEKNAS